MASLIVFGLYTVQKLRHVNNAIQYQFVKEENTLPIINFCSDLGICISVVNSGYLRHPNVIVSIGIEYNSFRNFSVMSA